MNANPEQPSAADVAALREELARLREDVARIAEALTGVGREKAEEAVAAGSAKLEELRREVERLTRELQTRGRDMVAGVEESVRERPLTSLMIAFGLGLLLSLLLVDRR